MTKKQFFLKQFTRGLAAAAMGLCGTVLLLNPLSTKADIIATTVPRWVYQANMETEDIPNDIIITEFNGEDHEGILDIQAEIQAEIEKYPGILNDLGIEQDTFTITAIGTGAFASEHMTGVLIPSTVKRIENNAFAICKSLSTSVTIPDGVTYIGDSAFSGCEVLSGVSIPQSVTHIGSMAFHRCHALANITYDVPNLDTSDMHSSGRPAVTIFEGAGKDADLTVTFGPHVVTVPDCLFYTSYDKTLTPYCHVKKVVLSDSVQKIADHAFYNCHDLAEIQWGENSGLLTIGKQAFIYCEALTNIEIPEGVTKIDDQAFSFNDNIVSLSLPKSLDTLGRNSFWGLEKLNSLTILAEKMTSGGVEAFARCGMNAESLEVTFGSDVTVVPSSIFSGTESKETICYMTKVVLSDSIETIGQGAFSQSARLAEVKWGAGIKTIENAAFANCIKLPSANLPNGVETIGDSAFSGCEALSGVSIPQSVTHIGSMAFHRCHALANIFYDVPNLDTSDMHSSGRPAVTIFEGAGKDADLTVTFGPHVVTVPDCLFYTNYDKTLTPYCHVKKVVLSDSVQKIADHAFYNCHDLASVTGMSAVESIGKSAFYQCELQTITPTTLTKENAIFEGWFTSKEGGSLVSKDTLEAVQSDQNVRGIIYAVWTPLGDETCSHTPMETTDESRLADFLKTPASCKEQAVYYHECAICHKKLTTTYTRGALKAHTPAKNQKHLKSEATCTAKAVYYEDCAVCGAKLDGIYEAGEMLSHKPVSDEKFLKSEATCTAKAVYYYSCKNCGIQLADTYEKGFALGHTKTEKINPASTTKDGSIISYCSTCEEILGKTVIPKAYVCVEETAKYTGKPISQPVKIIDQAGKKISSQNYTITYKNNKKVGTATVEVQFKNKYTSKVTKNFTIVAKDKIPANVKGFKTKVGKKKIDVSWKSGKGKISGYEIQYANDKNFLTGVKTIQVNKKDTSKTINKLTTKKTYYVRIRAVSKSGRTVTYSGWTSAKKCKIK